MTHEPPTGAQQRRGPFRAGERVQLTDPKGRLHTITLDAGATFHTHQGYFHHDALIGASEGSGGHRVGRGPVPRAAAAAQSDFVLSMPRGAQVVYPKDAGQVVTMGDIYPGARVVEAGVGSGALSMSLLRAVGDGGVLHSVERREDFAAIARANVEAFFGAAAPGVAADRRRPRRRARGRAGRRRVDRVVLDMLAPWENVDAVAHALAPGGVLTCYVATTTQLSRLAEDLRADGRFIEPTAWESMVRTWHLEGLAVRPDHRMIAHTGFLLTTRRMADGRRGARAHPAARQGRLPARASGTRRTSASARSPTRRSGGSAGTSAPRPAPRRPAAGGHRLRRPGARAPEPATLPATRPIVGGPAAGGTMTHTPDHR